MHWGGLDKAKNRISQAWKANTASERADRFSSVLRRVAEWGLDVETSKTYQFAGKRKEQPLMIVLAEPSYNSGPNFTVSSPIDKFPWAPMRPDIGCPGNRTAIPKVSDDQQRMIIHHHQ